jgi:hypothetical protein
MTLDLKLWGEELGPGLEISTTFTSQLQPGTIGRFLKKTKGSGELTSHRGAGGTEILGNVIVLTFRVTEEGA